MTEKDVNINAADAAVEETVQDTAEQPAEKKQAKKSKGDAAKLAALEEKLAAAEQEKAIQQDKLLRTAAEYDNFRRRSQKEHDAAFSNGVTHAVLGMLPIVDTLEAAANAETSDEEYKKGVLMTLAKCDEVFKKLGVSEIPSMDCEFDPEVHNACMQEPCDGVASGTITRVVQKGYMLGDKVIRHAMVAVAP